MPPSRRAFLQLAGAAALTPAWARSFTGAGDPAAAELCRKLASDPLRPQYHLLPAHNWMNDPNGPIFFRGRYHMFHQYNPQGAVWGNMNWAHASSPDMIHWKHEPNALSPTPGGPDSDGVFSGSAVLDRGSDPAKNDPSEDEGTPTVIYTGVAPPQSAADATLRDGKHTWRETQCLATAQDDNLRTWKKLRDPVIAGPPAGLAVTGFRDPYMWREGNSWMLTLGSGVRGKGGMVLLYTSPDLRHWTYLHPLVEGSSTKQPSANAVDTGDMWECPDFFPLGNKHVLLISTGGKVLWKVGAYENQRFTPEKEGVVDCGAYYAAKTTLDRDGNRILWGWITETRPEAELIAAGWAGAMSLPRVLSLNAQNELQTEVAPAFQRLRAAHSGLTGEFSSSARQKILEDIRIRDLSAELKLELRPNASDFAIHLQSDTGENFATISCASKSAGRELQVNSVKAPLPGEPGSSVQVHLLLDGSVLEVFVNQTTSVTARIYQVPSSPLRLKLEGDAELKSLEVWRITPISKDRLTGSLCSQAH
jgi:beta-fructofuranosidase